MKDAQKVESLFDITLKEIGVLDVNELDNSEYENLSENDRIKLIEESISGSHNGKFFKFFLIKKDGQTVGFINCCAHSENIISIAPEIKSVHRRKGYAKTALEKAYNYAKTQGYKIAIADIREENVSSINLHIKLGFEYGKSYINKNGKAVKFFIKAL